MMSRHNWLATSPRMYMISTGVISSPSLALLELDPEVLLSGILYPELSRLDPYTIFS